MDLVDAALLLIGGLCAGVINSLAGGGSLITVPLLALAGVGGVAANGTNRVAIVAQNASSVVGFARRGVGEWNRTVQVLIPTLLGAAAGSAVASALPDDVFERLFGVIMIPMLVLSIRRPAPASSSTDSEDAQEWSLWLKVVVFFAVGVYAGAIQAGVGILILLVLSRAGFDLVTANAMKVILILATAVLSSAVFIANGQVQWLAAAVLAVGASIGGYVGANLAVDGGERLIRPVLIVVVLVLASRMLGLWSLLG
jgi:uncharacterized membrane protein YfcA